MSIKKKRKKTRKNKTKQERTKQYKNIKPTNLTLKHTILAIAPHPPSVIIIE